MGRIKTLSFVILTFVDEGVIDDELLAPDPENDSQLVSSDCIRCSQCNRKLAHKQFIIHYQSVEIDFFLD